MVKNIRKLLTGKAIKIIHRTKHYRTVNGAWGIFPPTCNNLYTVVIVTEFKESILVLIEFFIYTFQKKRTHDNVFI